MRWCVLAGRFLARGPPANPAFTPTATTFQRLAQARAQMSAAELDRVLAGTAELKRLQEAPDSPEALASMPGLSLADLDMAA